MSFTKILCNLSFHNFIPFIDEEIHDILGVNVSINVHKYKCARCGKVLDSKFKSLNR